jgi:hypothetical protein
MTEGMETTIRRGRNNNPWVQAPKSVIENEAISVEARWLLVYLLGKPEGWIVRLTDIQNKSGWGRDKARRHIKELVAVGYLVPERVRDGGRFGSTSYAVFDTPHHELETSYWKPVTGEPATEEPEPVKPTPSKNDIYQELIPTKKEEKSAASPPFPSPQDIEWAVGLWNSMAGKAGLAQVRLLTDARRKKLRATLQRLGSRDAWREVIDGIYDSEFCRGRNDRGWRADFDFALQEKSLPRILEGFYDQKERT